MNKTIILCQDEYEAQKLSNFIFNKDGRDTFISEILNVVGNEIIVSLKDKSAHSIIVKDNQEVETFVDFIQSVIEKEHKILDVKIPGGASELSQVICAVGLCQNLGALRALASEGIQRGHMGLHARNLAVQAGAKDGEIDKVAEMLKRSGTVRADVAEKFLSEIRE